MKKQTIFGLVVIVICAISVFTTSVYPQSSTCNQYTINWYTGYYSEDGMRPTFPLKTPVNKSVFSQATTDKGVATYIILLKSAQLIDNVSRYEILLYIPSVLYKENTEIQITDSNLTEQMEGAVGRFRYSIGVAKDGENVGDNFWSNHDAGRDKVVGKIRFSSITPEKITGTFNFKAFATGYGSVGDEGKKKYVEIADGCFSADLKK